MGGNGGGWVKTEGRMGRNEGGWVEMGEDGWKWGRMGEN